jgi:hypothetical protein
MGSIARADSGLLRKQSSRHRSNERRIVEPNRAAAAAVDALSTRLNGEIAVTWSDRGTVQAVYGKLDNLGASSEQAARVFLSRQSDLFSLRADLADLTLVAERETPGGRCVDFQQDYMGVKVYKGVVSVAFDREDNVSVASGNYFGTINLETVTPSLTPDDVRSLVVARIRRAAGIEPTLNELVVYVDEQETAHLAYHVIQPTANKHGAAQTYETFVDATSGELLVTPHDINQYANGQVYKNGNAYAANGGGLSDTSSVPSTVYRTVTLQGLTSTTGLVGQYVDTHTLTTAANRATPDGSGNYVYTRSTTVSTGTKFDAVNTYFYVDDAQRYIQSLGFTNVNNRVVRFNVNGTTDDNSWYSPNASGTGDLTTGSGGVDDAEDGEVMLHEYGHSIQDNSRPGAWSGAQPGAMGEGFGDYWAASVTSQRHGQAGTAYETAVMEWDATSYSSSNPPTIRSITSTKHYPADMQNEVHADGEMWSSTLWQIRSDFIGLDGFSAGAQRADKVVLQSHFLVPISGNSFANGSNALITAATYLGYTQAEIDAIRNRCVARGFITGGGTCTYSISPTSASPSASATTGTVSVTAGSGCAWSATSNAAWLTITSGASGTGNGTVGYSVAANTGAARTGTITIAGKTFTVNQAAASSGCSSSTTAITTSGSGTLATTDCTITAGNGSAGGYYDNFTFSATAGQSATITLNSTAFDCYLRLYNSGGTQVATDDDSNGGTNSKIVYTIPASGTYTIKTTSYAPSSTGAYTVGLTLTGGGGGGTELVTDGGFETGASWVFGTYASRVTTSPQAGTYCAKLLGRGTTTSSGATIYQAPAFPTTGAVKTLRFYLKISTAESGSTPYDYLYVRIKNSSGTTLTTLATYTNANSGTYAGWTLVTLSIPASYAVSGNRLYFEGTEDVSLATTFYLDGVSIQ